MTTPASGRRLLTGLCACLGVAGAWLAMLPAPAMAAAADAAWSQAAVPAWVEPATPVYDPPPAVPAEAPRAYLVLDRQVRIEPGGDSAYQQRSIGYFPCASYSATAPSQSRSVG